MNSKQKFLSPRMGRVNHIHFVGIGGAGMSGIAEMLNNEGYHVTGSDLGDSRVVQHLQAIGIKVNIGHDAQNIQGADVVVRSTAVSDDNPEIIAATQQMKPIIPRAMMLAELMRFRYGIAIAGTHGKTTTTSLVSSLLAEGGLDPSFVIGGKLNSSGMNAQLGRSSYFVVEADESDASFLFLKPMIAVVTNIDEDHMGTYGNSFNKLCSTFVEFLHHLPFYGLAVMCVDDENVRRVLPEIQRPVLTYGFREGAHYQAIDWTQNGLLSQYTVLRPAPHAPLTIQLKWPGRHNVQNSLASIAIATELGVSDEAILRGLINFQGVGRRFQMLGEHHFKSGKALIVDDYGHHPQEIQSTIEAFRLVWPDKRLLHVFQPHRYTRTQALFSQFVDVLSLADELLLLDIYSAGEPTIPGIDSASLAEQISKKFPHVTLVTEQMLVDRLDNLVADGDVVLMQGAGTISQMANNLFKLSENA